jgi:hypothetical protein
MTLKICIFSMKYDEKIGDFCSNYCYVWQKRIMTLVFQKNDNFFDENWQKSRNIEIKTSNPGFSEFKNTIF